MVMVLTNTNTHQSQQSNILVYLFLKQATRVEGTTTQFFRQMLPCILCSLVGSLRDPMHRIDVYNCFLFLCGRVCG